MSHCILPVYGLYGLVFHAVNSGIKRSRAVWACRVDLAAHSRHLVSLIGNKSEQIKSPVQLPRLVTFTHWSLCLWRRRLPNSGCCLDMWHWPIFLPNIVSYVGVVALVTGLVQQWRRLHQERSDVYLKYGYMLHWRVMKRGEDCFVNCSHPVSVYGAPSATLYLQSEMSLYGLWKVIKQMLQAFKIWLLKTFKTIAVQRHCWLPTTHFPLKQTHGHVPLASYVPSTDCVSDRYRPMPLWYSDIWQTHRTGT